MTIENKEEKIEQQEEELDDQQETGTQDEGEEDEGTEGSESGNGSKQEDSKSYTQKELNRMMAREKKQGRNAALRELGIDPKDTKTLSLLQNILKGTKNDQQDASAGDQKVAEAEERALVAEIKAEAMKQGAQSNFVDDIVTLVKSKMNADEDADMLTIIGEFKTKYANWFEKADEDDKQNSIGKKGTGSSVKSKSVKNENKETENLGKRLAAQRKSQNSSKKSFWS